MMIERFIKILASGALAILCTLIAITNFQDPPANMAFVQHVLSMDYLPADSPLAQRAL